MVKNGSICLALLVIASVTWSARPQAQMGRMRFQATSAPSCRHTDNAIQADRDRAVQAVALAKAINAAESEIMKRVGQYAPFSSLSALPAAPDGFKVYLYANRTGYLFSLKDTLDPCRFAVFSDVAGLIYQQSALTAPVVAQ